MKSTIVSEKKKSYLIVSVFGIKKYTAHIVDIWDTSLSLSVNNKKM